MDLEIRDRVFILTGAARGLGRATADALVAEGAKVVLSGRSEESLATAVAELGEDSATSVVADNADPETSGRLIAARPPSSQRFPAAALPFLRRV